MATSSTCRPTRSTPFGTTPAARRRPCTASAAPTGSAPSRACAPRCVRSPRNWLCCTGGASPVRGTSSRPTRRGNGRSKRPSPTRRRPTRRRPSSTSSPTWRPRPPWIGSSAATSGSARPKSPSEPPSRPCRTAGRSPSSYPRRCSPSSTSRRSRSALPATRCEWRSSPGSSPRARPGRWWPGWPTGRSMLSSAPTAC